MSIFHIFNRYSIFRIFLFLLNDNSLFDNLVSLRAEHRLYIELRQAERIAEKICLCFRCQYVIVTEFTNLTDTFQNKFGVHIKNRFALVDETTNLGKCIFLSQTIFFDHKIDKKSVIIFQLIIENYLLVWWGKTMICVIYCSRMAFRNKSSEVWNDHAFVIL